MGRKHYIDNLRWAAILMLFPFHAAQIWCIADDGGFYIWSHESLAMHVFSNIVYPWYMTLLFVLAGMSCKYAFTKRTAKQFMTERVKKLLVPFVFGVLVLAPVMTYIAEIYFNGYTGSYIHQYKLFFTKETNMTGYRGGFTPGHYWFLLYLFVISLLSLVIIALLKNTKLSERTAKLPYAAAVLLFIPEWLCLYALNIGGKSVGQFLMLYMTGYYILSDEAVLEKIREFRFVSLALCIASGSAYIGLYCFAQVKNEWITGIYILYGWTGILTWLGIGQTCFDRRNKLTVYLSRASFPIYILHMPILVVVGYFVLKLKIAMAAQFVLIMLISAAATFTVYEIVRRIPVLRALIGISKRKTKETRT